MFCSVKFLSMRALSALTCTQAGWYQLILQQKKEDKQCSEKDVYQF